MQRIALIGYRGTGKSTVGQRVAARLGWPFCDADEILEARAGRPIRDLFASEGESAFRDREAALLLELTEKPQLVLATGGGVILRPGNRERLRATCWVVWLTAAAELVWERMQADPLTAARRPNLTPLGGLAEVRQVFHEREPLYRQTAHQICDGSRSPEQVADDIVNAFELHGHHRPPA